MIKYGKIIIGLVLLVSLALVLSYCSSKSSDSGTTSTGTASAGAGASASTSAIQSATLGLSATAGSNNAPSFMKTKSLSKAVNGFYSGLRAKRADTGALKAKLLASAALATGITTSCTGGGDMTVDISSDGTTTTLTTTYSNCTQNSSSSFGTVSTVLNGALVFADSDQSFTFSLGNSTTPYSMKMTQASTGTVLQETVATMTYVGASDLTSMTTCTPLVGTPITEYTTMTITMDGNMRLKGIDDSGSAYDETIVATAFKMISTIDRDPDTCDITGGTIQESGATSYTDNLDASENVSITISASNPLTLTWTSVTGGDTYRISGTISVVTQCFTGTLTLATTTPIFIPTDADCPTAGVVTVSGDVTGTVVYTSTGGVQIKDSSGAVVETYSSCDDVQACT